MKQPKNNWKKELLQREIKPSEEVWLNVAHGLKQPKNKINKKRIWIGLTAAAIAAILILPNFLQLSNKNSPEIPIVHQEKIEESKTKVSKEIQPLQKEYLATKKQQALKVAVEEKQLSSKESKTPSSSEKTKNKVAKHEEALMAKTTSKLTKTRSEALNLLAEVEAEIEKEQPKNANEEAENLLAQAEQNIEKANYNQLFKFAEANQLLAEVEEDLSKNDLKERIFKFLKNNYKEIESAVASLK